MKSHKQKTKPAAVVPSPSSRTKASHVAASDRNPRKVTNARLAVLRRQLTEFGDLGGIVFNRRTDSLVSGHQRMKEFRRTDADITIDRTFEKPTKSGTVAEGHLMLDGERFGFREVDWDPAKETAAMLAANNHAGEWENDMVRAMVRELDAGTAQELTGFDPATVKAMTAEPETEGMQNDETDKVPKEREVYIVPLALTRAEWRTWEAKKMELGKANCKRAFLQMIGGAA